MTYASGLDAATIVWIAAEFAEEHRSALDWLNEITADEFKFFGLEVELWQIGDSDMAPKFNIVSKPNDWSRSVSDAASHIHAELNETQKLQLEYWTNFRKLLETQGSLVRPTKPAPHNYAAFSIGHSDFWLAAFTNLPERKIGVMLGLQGPNAKPHFHLLQQQKQAIEQEISGPLEWHEKSGKESHIMVHWHGADPADREQWNKQHQWFFERLQRFHKTFLERIRTLNADDFGQEIPVK